MIKHDYKIMEKICSLPIRDFGSTYNMKRTKTVHGDLFYQSNGAKILGVAHLDSVQKPAHFKVTELSHKTLVFSPVLDDRLGAYILLYLLPKLGIKIDVLLTEGEESGMSTADFFKTNKKYNWMFQFDRTGTDVVMYDYEESKYVGWLRKMGFTVGMGAFSDICFLEDLGITGFNFGCAYHDYHTLDAYCNINDLDKNIGRFSRFFRKYKDTLMPYDPATAFTKWNNYGRSYDDVYDNYPNTWDYDGVNCYNCGTPLAKWERVTYEGICNTCHKEYSQ